MRMIEHASALVAGASLKGLTCLASKHTVFRNDGSCWCRSWSLLCCAPLTGRTHQIRLHVAHMGHPIASDNLYGLQVVPTLL